MTDKDFRFFYLDDENEVISITSQADLAEALNIYDLNQLKLAVADNMQEAVKILFDSMQESSLLSNSINQSQSQITGRSRFNSEADQILRSQTEAKI